MSKLERATHVSLIIVALVSIGLILERRFAPAATQPNTQQLMGRHLSVSGAKWESSPLNVVLYMSTQCRFCAASMSFYRRMVAERDGAKSKSALTVLSLQPPEEMRALLSRERVSVDGVFLVPSSPGLSVTPMLFVNAHQEA